MSTQVLYLSHADSIDLFEKNTGDKYTVELNKQIELSEGSTVELLEFRCRLKDKTTGARLAVILCDICENSVFFGSHQPVLRVVRIPPSRNFAIDFPQTIKLRLIDNKINRIGVHIRPLGEDLTPFGFEESYVTLRINHGSSN